MATRIVGAVRWWLGRPARVPRGARLVVALACGAAALLAATGSSGQPSGQQPPPPGPSSAAPALLAEGRALYADGCSSCHGVDLRGVPRQGPALRGVGAGPVDFYLSTGRMPLDNPTDEPVRNDPAYGRREIDALVAYVASFGGPPAPNAHPERGSISEGFDAFLEHCAGCHQSVAQGGLVTGSVVPDLQKSTPRQVAEAVRMGPYVMPVFNARQIPQPELDSIARYVLYTRHPQDEGGWGIGHIGPIPEGMVAWLIGLLALVIVIRLIGERIGE
jgi:ubiquinol-cytochrome c reductase cytochrome c subunit